MVELGGDSVGSHALIHGNKARVQKWLAENGIWWIITCVLDNNRQAQKGDLTKAIAADKIIGAPMLKM